MSGFTRVWVGSVRPGDEVRKTRSEPGYLVADVAETSDSSWTVLGTDGITRHYAARARLLRNDDRCDGQTSLLDDLEGAA